MTTGGGTKGRATALLVLLLLLVGGYVTAQPSSSTAVIHGAAAGDVALGRSDPAAHDLHFHRSVAPGSVPLTLRIAAPSAQHGLIPGGSTRWPVAARQFDSWIGERGPPHLS